jgi:hypothetical protein
MHNHSVFHATARLQSNLDMLKSSLKKIYPAQNDRQFNDLLRALDSGSSSRAA